MQRLSDWRSSPKEAAMAELIPLEYRIAIARARLISRWTTAFIVTAAVAAAALLTTYTWRRQQAAQCARLEQQYRDNAVLLRQFSELRAKRDNLAACMQKMEDLRTDKVLLSLLNTVSRCFSESDCLNYICVDAHRPERRSVDGKTPEAQYSVRIHGITVDDISHSRFLERLTAAGKESDPPINVPLGEKHLIQMFDGAVTSFDITCDQPLAKGG
jgi:hypothetical protein